VTDSNGVLLAVSGDSATAYHDTNDDWVSYTAMNSPGAAATSTSGEYIYDNKYYSDATLVNGDQLITVKVATTRRLRGESSW